MIDVDKLKKEIDRMRLSLNEISAMKLQHYQLYIDSCRRAEGMSEALEHLEKLCPHGYEDGESTYLHEETITDEKGIEHYVLKCAICSKVVIVPK